MNMTDKEYRMLITGAADLSDIIYRKGFLK